MVVEWERQEIFGQRGGSFMRIVLLVALAAFLISSYVTAADLFEECKNVLGERGYEPLKAYFSKADTDTQFSSYCQRLNNREFLYTDPLTIYYCKEDKDHSLSCDWQDTGMRYPDIQVVKRFTGKNGKQYVLFRTMRLSHGEFSGGYYAFYLVPKTANRRGYAIFDFAGAGEYNGLYSDAGEVCSNIRGTAVTAMPVPFEIVEASSGNPVVRFNQELVSCKSQKKTRQTLEYTWEGGTFRKTLDKREPVVPKAGGAKRGGAAMR